MVSGGGGQREQRGNVGGKEPVEADQGETSETRRVGSFSEGVSRHRGVPVKSQSRQDCAISYQTCVVCLMMCSTN